MGRPGTSRNVIIVVIICVVVIVVSQVIQRNVASREFRTFAEKCDFVRIEVSNIKVQGSESTITDQTVICGLWEFIRSANLPSQKEARLYDYSLTVNFVSKGNTRVTIGIDKDRGHRDVEIGFVGRHSNFSMRGIDKTNVVDELLRRIGAYDG